MCVLKDQYVCTEGSINVYLHKSPGAEEIFRPSRPALGPTQPPVKWVRSLSWR